MTNDVSIRRTAEQLVLAHQQANEELKQAFAHLMNAKKIVADALGDNRGSLWASTISDYNLSGELEKCQIYLKQNIWRKIVARLQLREVMAIADQRKLDAQLEAGKELPEPTLTNLLSFFNQVGEDLPKLLDANLKEVFRYFTPQRTKFKSMKRDVIGSTLILDGAVGMFGMISEYTQPYIQALDNALSLLDGKGVTKYPHSLVVEIQTHGRNKPCDFTFTYYRCKIYMNGNLHIKILRPDLLRELNKRALNGTRVGGSHAE